MRPQRSIEMHFCLLGLAVLVRGMCPTGCDCTSDERHSVTCDGAQLQDIPSLLDPRTRRLSLAYCDIRKLDADVLELYADLEYLDLSNNGLEDIGRGFFRYQTRLKVLKLNGNKVATIQREAFVGLNALQVLDLSSNGLVILDSYSLQELANVTEVNLSNNSISDLQPRVFSGLTNLRIMRISNNRLRHLTSDALKPLKKLRDLDLRRNLISVVSAGAFSAQSSLLHVDFSSNLVSLLTEHSLMGLTSIRHLNISNNIVHKIPSLNLRFLPTLEVLDLSWNSVAEIGTSSFEGLSSLRYLTLAHQQNLRAIHLNAFSGLNALAELDISSCRALESIDKNAFESTLELRWLDISRCAFRSLPPTLLNWNRLITLNVYGNPFHCDPELLSFLPRVLRQLDIHNASCLSPKELRDEDIASLEALATSMSEWEITLIIVCSVLTLLSLLAVPVCLMCGRTGLFAQSKPKTRTPFYDRSILSSSLTHDKADLLTKQTFYSPSEFSASTASTFEETSDRYSKLTTPPGAALAEADQEEQTYERPISAGAAQAQQTLASQSSSHCTSRTPSSKNSDEAFHGDVPTFPAPPITQL